MERESNNNRMPAFPSARTVRIFGADITVPYNGGRRRRRHGRPPALPVQSQTATHNSNPTEASQTIDFIESQISRGGGRSSSNPGGLATGAPIVTGGAARMMNGEESSSFPFRFESGPPPLRDFLRIGDTTRQPPFPVMPPPPPPPYPPNIHHHHHHHHPTFDADNLRTHMALLLTQIRANMPAALGGCVDAGVVDAFAEHLEAMMEAVEAARACAVCMALSLSLN